jgi:hypothetical protein
MSGTGLCYTSSGIYRRRISRRVGVFQLCVSTSGYSSGLDRKHLRMEQMAAELAEKGAALNCLNVDTTADGEIRET